VHARTIRIIFYLVQTQFSKTHLAGLATVVIFLSLPVIIKAQPMTGMSTQGQAKPVTDQTASAKPQGKPAQSPQDVLYPQLPRWEAGLGAALIRLPDYPASGEVRTRFLPLPYFIYRGDFVRADRDGGIRGRFLKSENFEFDLSFGAAFPARSTDNEARMGMPDLDWMGEVGPRLLVHLYKGRMVKLDLSLPVRYVFSTDLLEFNSRGFVFNPQLSFRHRALFDSKTFFAASVGPTWATEDTQDYIYEVEPKYVTNERPQYDARSGYMGTNFSVSVGRRWQHDVTTFLGVSKNYFSGSENRTSPLFLEKETESYFLGVVWSIWHSKERAHMSESEDADADVGEL